MYRGMISFGVILLFCVPGLTQGRINWILGATDVNLDQDGDSVLDFNVFVALDGHADRISMVIEDSRTSDVLKVLRVSKGDKNFREWFGEDVVVAFYKVGTEIRHMDVLFETIECSQNFEEELLNLQRVEIGWVNFEADTIEVFWMQQPSGKLYSVGEIPPGEKNTQWRSTFIGHEFVLKRKNGSEISFRVQTEEFHRLGNFPSNVGSRRPPPQASYDSIHNLEIRKASKIKRNFTEAGYKLIPTPRKLFADVRRFFNVNKNQGFIEDFRSGIYINDWVADVYMVPPPFSVKNKWHAWLQPVLEDWSKTELEPTDLYGVRTYREGAVLLDHVDRHRTHAVSAIINIAQEEMREDWELEIFAVNGTIVHSPLQEGETMLYESALCMHGRPRPLEGKSYTNLFFHYRPKGDPEWYLEDSVKQDETIADEDDYEEDEYEDEYEEDEYEEKDEL